ncbi:hypothetical protein MMC21_004741 [Puttea exsequens]|nr:hypothetical protein [Puttea exsequens]
MLIFNRSRTVSLPIRATGFHPIRNFTSSNAVAAAQLPPRPKIKEEDIVENFLKGSGPGGQKINKTNSAVQLKHTPTGTVVKSQATRSRSQNRKIARRVLAEKLEEVEKGSESRTALKAATASKKKAAKTKKAKKKYRALDEAKESQDKDEVKMDEVEEVEMKEERV